MFDVQIYRNRHSKAQHVGSYFVREKKNFKYENKKWNKHEWYGHHDLHSCQWNLTEVVKLQKKADFVQKCMTQANQINF